MKLENKDIINISLLLTLNCRLKGVKVGHVLTCLVCGQETRVEDIPLQKIKEASLLAQSLLCDNLDWEEGIKVRR